MTVVIPVRVLTSITLLSLLSVCGLSACQPSAPPAERPPVELVSDNLTGDDIAGKALFEEECSKCHQLTAGHNSKGPQLRRIYGATAGTLADYQDRYSTAMKATHWQWDADTLSSYLENPDRSLPNGKMLYDGMPDEDQRNDVIAYLATLR
jgi:cytochrome c